MLRIIMLLLLLIHVFSAIIFVGGSIFIWAILWPESYKLNDEKMRTRLLGFVGKRFALYTNVSFGLLIVTGLIMTYKYLLNFNLYFKSLFGELLFTAEILVIILLIVMYGNNIYHGKLIVRLNEQGRFDEIKRIRKRTHFYSMLTMAIMIVIVGIMVTMHVY